ncbi:hypothetical protein KI387_000435 [Taxus chinensis]|uniref:Uncharacterized protein n=1 Tax=Taxus chinensis TaxID=29808 RepID=A0AA38LP23_TAXCH|nr:hypothetical protein KI387_000435 [Taxus chinensis]
MMGAFNMTNTGPVPNIGGSRGGSGGAGGSGSSGSGGGGNTRGNRGTGSGGQGPQPPPQVFFEMSLHLLDYSGIEYATEHVHKCEMLWRVKGITTQDRKAKSICNNLARMHA